MRESEEELKCLLIQVKEVSEEVGLKLSLQKAKIMAFSLFTSWQIDGETCKQWQTLFLGFQIHCEQWLLHEIKRCFPLGRKATTNLDSILSSRDILLPTKLHIVKAMVFAVVMYGWGRWTTKKTEGWRTDTFELWCSRRSWESLGLQGDPTS